MGILDAKAGVVTGGGRGIGRAECLELAHHGMAVVVNDIDGEEAEKVAKEISAAGGRAVANSESVGTREGCQRLIEHCVSAFGRLDAVINNAGIVRDRSFLNMTDDDFEAVYATHAKATFWCGQIGARVMRDQGSGVIINTTSGVHMGNYGQTNYAAAKGAIASMTYTWAIELARYGIRVNAIAPQATTRMTAAVKDASGKPVDESRFLDPALNAPMVAFLCSDEADWVTGQVFALGANRLGIMHQPRYGDMMYREGGWTLEAIRQLFPRTLGNRLEPFGLAKQPYAYFGGVKAQSGA
jgi:NAD(P)-dependent dehydrogenase (short-subunit alcohol dehydrogenase family)